MGYFIFVALIVLSAAAVYMVLSYMNSEPVASNEYGRGGSRGFNAKPFQIGVVVTTALLLALVTILASTAQVENGHIGIVKQFGSLVGTTGEGLVTKAPWQSLKEVSVQEEQNTYEMTQAGGGTAVSSDSQEIGLVVQVRYQLQRAEAVPLYRITGGHFEERILDPAVFQNTKEVTAGYKAIDFAKNREQIRREIEAAINTDTQPHGIVVKNVTIKNFILSDELNTAIEDTIKTEQEAVREEARVRKVNAEAAQKIAAAEGEKKATILKAEGDAAANKLRERNLTPLLVQWEAIQRLNDKVQVIVCPPRTVCIPNAAPVNP